MVKKLLINEFNLLDILDKKKFLSRKGKKAFKTKATKLSKILIKEAKTKATKELIKSRFKKRFK